MLGPADIRARAIRLWDSQRLLRAWASGEPLFPHAIPLGLPTGSALATRFKEVSDTIRALRAGAKAPRGRGYSLVEEAIAHRQLGAQRVPVRAVIETLEDALHLAGKQQDFARFVTLAEETRFRVPPLGPYLEREPAVVLAHADAWSRLLSVCAHLREHPRPGCYVRELEITGVDTKFIGTNEALLWDLLNEALPPEAIDADVALRTQRGFERRFGFRFEAPTIRLRALDPALAPGGFSDVAVPLPELAAWKAPVRRVYVTENKLNGLAFPEAPGAIVIFGLGYGVGALAELPWLADVELVYWGDLDTHGFAMLDALRAAWPHTRSLAMDEATLLAHRAHWGEETGKRCLLDLAHLDDDERSVYEGMRADRWGPRVRLEQERVPLSWLERARAPG